MPIRFEEPEPVETMPRPPPPLDIGSGTVSTHVGVRRLFCMGEEDDDDRDREEFEGGRERSLSFLELVFGRQEDNLTPEERMVAKRISKSKKQKKKSKWKDAQSLVTELMSLRNYVAFVPRYVVPQLRDMGEARARVEVFQGVVSFLDVAGFTKLTERLARQPDGAERLAKIINALLGQLLNTLESGDIIKFSGDAVLVLYQPDRTLMSDTERSYAEQDDAKKANAKNGIGTRVAAGYGTGKFEDIWGMRNAANRAVSEGLNALYDDYTVTAEEMGDMEEGVDGITLKMHVTVTVGDLQMMHVGGTFGRWEVVMAGPAMLDLGPTADRSPTDWLTVHPRVWELLENSPLGLQFDGSHLKEGDEAWIPPKEGAPKEEYANEDYVRVTSKLDPNSGDTVGALMDGLMMGANPLFAGIAGAAEGIAASMGMERPHHSRALEMVDERGLNTPEDLGILRRYVTPLIQQAIATRTLDAVSCFIQASVMFVGISGIDLGQHNDEADMLWGQIIMSTVQECVYDFEGAVNKFVMDDKGALLLCAWGLPPMTHTDDPYRATAAALQLSNAFNDLGVSAKVGVTTGKVFAGVIGPPHRCEFSLLGDTVNLAARLMVYQQMGCLQVDQATYDSAKVTGMEFEVLEPIKVKGKDGKQNVFKPTNDARTNDAERAVVEGRKGNSSGDGGGSGSGGGGNSPRPRPGLSSGVSRGARKSMWTSGRRDSFDTGAMILSQGMMRTKERGELFAIMDSLFLDGGGMLVLSGDAGSGKSELAKTVLASAETYNARLIQSLTPKNQGKLSVVSKKPCAELSQVLRGLLTPELSSEESADPEKLKAAIPMTVDGWKGRLREYIEPSKQKKLEPLMDLYDDYFAEWVERTKEELQRGEGGEEGGSNEIFKASLSKSNDMDSFLDEGRDSVMDLRGSTVGGGAGSLNSDGGDGEDGEGSANGGDGGEGSRATKRASAFKKLKSKSMSLDEGGGDDGPGGKNGGDLKRAGPQNDGPGGRLKLLSAVLDFVLKETRPLMVFVHVRTSSSLSANAAHPEMWGVLKHLSDYAVARYEDAQYSGPRKSDRNSRGAAAAIFGSAAHAASQKIHPFVVALTHRRVLDFGGGSMNQMYSEIIHNAETCDALVQLDPLDEVDREDYLCLSLRVAKVPLSVSTWVSDVANGNPQYIEICAGLIDNPKIIKREQDPDWSIDQKMNGGSPSKNRPGSAPIGGNPAKGKGADNGVWAKLVPNGGAEALKDLEKPPKIMGYIKQTIGSLGPQDMLVVKVLSLFAVDTQDEKPLPTLPVIARAYRSMAEITGGELVEVLNRLALYGLIVVHDGSDPPSHHHVVTRKSFYEEDNDHRESYYYTICWPLLQEMAAEQLLLNQKEAIEKSMWAPTENGNSDDGK